MDEWMLNEGGNALEYLAGVVLPDVDGKTGRDARGYHARNAQRGPHGLSQRQKGLSLIHI